MENHTMWVAEFNLHDGSNQDFHFDAPGYDAAMVKAREYAKDFDEDTVMSQNLHPYGINSDEFFPIE